MMTNTPAKYLVSFTGTETIKPAALNTEKRAPFHFCLMCPETWGHSFDGDCCPDDERGQLCDECVLDKFPMSAEAEDRRVYA